MPEFTGFPGYPYKPRKKKSCRGCVARVGDECVLGFTIVDDKPAGVCPKPKSRHRLARLFELLYPELMVPRAPIDFASEVERVKGIVEKVVRG